MATLLREELVELSVLRQLTTELPSFGYTVITGDDLPADFGDADLHVRESFPRPEMRTAELRITTLAFGFNIDDGGRAVELGSNLTEYTHTLTCWVFGLEPRFARRIAHTVKHIARGDNDRIPLLDFGQDGDPQIDALYVPKVQVQHQVNNSPRPWDQYVWTAAIEAQDVFTP